MDDDFPSTSDVQFALIIASVREGDPNAYRELMQTSRVLLEAYLGRGLQKMNVRDQATKDDLVQEVLLTLHAKWHTYDPKRPFLPWLFAISKYRLIDFARQEKRKPIMVAIEEVQESISEAFTHDAHTDQADELRRLIGGLSEKSRRAIELVKLEGLPIAEAARLKQQTEGALKVTLHRAIKFLQRSQKSEDNDAD